MSAGRVSTSSRPQRQVRSIVKAPSYDSDDREPWEDDDDEDDQSGSSPIARRTPRRSESAQTADYPGHSPGASTSRGPGRPRIHKKRSRTRIDSVATVAANPQQADDGWMPPPESSDEARKIYDFVLQTLKSYQNAKGRRLAETVETVPQDQAFQARTEHLLTLTDIETRVASQRYATSQGFERDLCQMFTSFRRGYELGSQQYGDVAVLQRLFQALTKSHPSGQETTLETVQDHWSTSDATHNFSSVTTGPGPLPKGQLDGTDLHSRPSVRGKTYYTHSLLKGQQIAIGDWVHLANPSEPSKPIVAQIFKIFTKEEDPNGPPQLSCCWYLRPEQTIHPKSRTFTAEEVVKTGLFSDHAVEDVLEKVYVLFYTKWCKARPSRQDWDPKSPLYYCENRYSEKDNEFNKIKNWNSCIPEEVRGGGSDLRLQFFIEPILPPKRYSSPFLRGIKGPGRLCEEPSMNGAREIQRPIGKDLPDPFADPSSRQNKRVRREETIEEGAINRGLMPSVRPGNSSPWTAPAGGGSRSPAYAIQPPPSRQQIEQAQSTLKTLNPTLHAALKGEYPRIIQLLAGSNAMNVDLQGVSRGIGGAIDVQTLGRWREALQTLNMANVRTTSSSSSRQQQQRDPHRFPIDRNIVTALQGVEAYVKELPQETIDLFGEGEEEVVKWFAAPPLAHDGSLLGEGGRALPSLDYLYHRAVQKQEGR